MKDLNNLPISMRDIQKAQERIASMIRRTPLLESCEFRGEEKPPLKLKLENLQVTGSFKIRGAVNKMLTLSDFERKQGVITVSSGNHGRAVSYAARQLGIYAVVCLPETVPENKIAAIRDLGAEVIVHGATYDDADSYAHSIQKERQLAFIHPFDDPEVIAGQGTIGLELLKDYPEIDTVIVPLSGGGLLSGIALALKSANAEIRTIGVSMERGPAMVESLNAGEIIEVVEEPTIADALAGGIDLKNRFTFQMIQELMDEAVLVSEEEIAYAMAFALDRHNLVIEGGGAVGLAAMIGNKLKNLGCQIAIVISGGNVEISKLCEVYEKNLHLFVAD